MSRFCVECGAVLSGRSFCGECGHHHGATVGSTDTAAFPATPAPPATGGSTAATPPLPPVATAAPQRGPRRRRVTVAAAAVAVSVVALSGLAVHTQAQSSSDADQKAAAPAATQSTTLSAAQPAAADSAAPTPQSAATPAGAATTAPNPRQEVPASAVPAEGRWQGVLDDGAYTFDMTLAEDGGGVSGTVYEYDTADGDSGTQVLTGYRYGNTLHLRGTEYLDSSPGWKLDEFTVELHPDGTMSGTFNCVGCRALLPVAGERA